jgi:hypothetical protein
MGGGGDVGGSSSVPWGSHAAPRPRLRALGPPRPGRRVVPPLAHQRPRHRTSRQSAFAGFRLAGAPWQSRRSAPAPGRLAQPRGPVREPRVVSTGEGGRAGLCLLAHGQRAPPSTCPHRRRRSCRGSDRACRVGARRRRDAAAARRPFGAQHVATTGASAAPPLRSMPAMAACGREPSGPRPTRVDRRRP